VWSGRDQDQIAVLVGGEFRDELVALVTTATPSACVRARVCLVDDYELRASPHEVVAPLV
jgi:hypothetical protein